MQQQTNEVDNTKHQSTHTAGFGAHAYDSAISTGAVPSAEDYFESPTVEMDKFDRKVSRSVVCNAAHANKYPRVELNKLKEHINGGSG